MSSCFQFFIIFCFFKFAFSENDDSNVVTYYINPDMENGGDGLTPETAWRFNWDFIIRNIKRKGGSYSYILNFNGGDYFINQDYGISITSANSPNFVSMVLKPTDINKKVRLICGVKLTNDKFPNAWTRSSISDKFWIFDPTREEMQGFTVKSLIVNGKRAQIARIPSAGIVSQTIRYSEIDDPTNPNYMNRHFEVPDDCIEILNKTLKSQLGFDEIANAKFVDYHYWTFSREPIISVDYTNRIITTNVSKAENGQFGQGKVRAKDYFIIENLLIGLNEPGEYYTFPNRSILYYPRLDEDMSDMTKTEVIVTTHGIALHATQRSNLRVEGFEIIGAENSGIYMTGMTNLNVVNNTIRNTYQGIFIANTNNLNIEHNLVEHTGSYAVNIRNNNFMKLHNNIIREYAETNYLAHGVWVYEKSNNTQITNNDIGGGYHSPIQIFHRYSDYKDQYAYNLVRDNHCHHAGYGLMDDMGGITALFVAPGVFLDHNYCHDIYSKTYCGGGFLTGSNSYDVWFTNNLIHDTSHNSIKCDLGQYIHVHNNILTFNAQSVLTHTSNTENLQWDIHKNIFVFNSTILMGAFNNKEAINDIDNNIYWHSTGAEINFRKMTFEAWQSEPFNHDQNSYIVDPLFVNVYRENGKERDFNFKSDTEYKKIGFEPFSLTFGVVNDETLDSSYKSWIDTAKDHDYVAYFERPAPWQLFSGFEDFEHGFSARFWSHTTIIPGDSVIEITKENPGVGSSQSTLQFGPVLSTASTKPSISVIVEYQECKAEISLDIYLPEDADFQFGLGDVSYLQFSKGTIQYYTGKQTKKVGAYPLNQWINVKFNNNYGSERTEQTTLLTVKDYSTNTIEQMTYGVRTSYTSVTSFKMILAESSSNVYIDNLNFSLDRKADCQFDQEFAKTKKLTSIYNFEETDETNNPDQENKNKNKTGLIVGIVIAIIVVIGVVVGVGIWYYLKHRPTYSETAEENLFASMV